MGRKLIIVLAALAGAAVLARAEPGRAGAYEEAIIDEQLGYHREAFRKFSTLAVRGHPEATFRLAALWHKGRGTPQNYDKAHATYLRAARLGSTNAQNNLGLLFRDGLGVESDPVAAYAWFALAAARDNRVARENRNHLRHRLSAEQLRRAQAQAERTMHGLKQAARMASTAVDTKGDVARSPATTSEVLPVDVASSVPPLADAAASAVVERMKRPARPRATPPSGGTGAAEGGPHYVVQIGVFGNPHGVRRIHSRLGESGMALRDDEVTLKGKAHHRLRVGPFTTITEAKEVASRVDDLLRLTSLVVRTSGD